jgi:two-component system, LytTR family, response regulator
MPAESLPPALANPPPLRVLIADDEPAARQRLRRQLAAHPDIEIVAECSDGRATLETLQRLRPALALLDIQMPGLDGLAVVRSLAEEQRPIVIFVTAHEGHALHAFGVQAADYLLKPFTRERLALALTRARALCHSSPPALAAPPSDPVEKTAPLNRLVVPTGERMLVVPAGQIDWIESAGNYAVIHVGHDTHVLRETLLELENRLAQGQFLRISRTAIVNLDRVRELRADAESGHIMVLADGTKLGITRGIREVQKRLETG